MSASGTRRSAARVGVLGAILAISATGIVHAPVVGAQPVAIDSAQEATDRLAELGHESATTNEQLLQAQDRLTAARDDEQRATDQLAADEAAVADAGARIEQMRPEIDRIVAANYQGARTNRLFAVMVSDSPQQLLDQMSVLDVVSHRVTSQLAQFAQASSDARAAEDASQASADAARVATEAAQRTADELQAKQDELHGQIAEVIAAYAALTGDQQAAYAGTLVPPGVNVDDILGRLMPGANTSVLQAALTQLGKPYVWGATGPDGFDCSGLMQWAYAQVGKQIPRTSQAQAAGGIPVSQADLQPGDIVVFYPGQTHVGMYAGNGNIVHASTFGVPVKVQSMAGMPFNSARRY
ncbi:C40 family peptidase [Millisia brevis]|uniref:C40 family peptidase n=1 Tax=Millisia brevis TaxID=264148 RepID=UPI000834D4B7|nr:C40 family peptidase [Millisia brevis]